MEFLPHFNQSASGSVEQLPPQTALSDAMDAAEVVEDLVYIEWLQSEFLKVQSSSLGPASDQGSLKISVGSGQDLCFTQDPSDTYTCYRLIATAMQSSGGNMIYTHTENKKQLARQIPYLME